MGAIAFVTDERLSREKSAILNRIVAQMRQIGVVEVIGSSVTEDELIKKLDGKNYQLVLVPWYRYLAWSRVEAFYGLTRTSGPTFAGYFCEPLLPYELGDISGHLRTILLDFANLRPHEIMTLLKSLIVDSKRTGIRPLTESANVYCESWYGNQGLGLRMDAVLTLPEIAQSDWMQRAASIRICLNALWSLIYDEGPGKSELAKAVSVNAPKAYFQIACDSAALVMRLCYSVPGWTPKDALALFWPDPKAAVAAPQILLKYSDYVRAHTIIGTSDVEIVVGLLGSAPSVTDHDKVHTLWVEPIAVNLVSEVPFEVPNPASPHLRQLTSPSLEELKPRSVEENENVRNSKERFIFEAATKIRMLKTQLTERDDKIKELKTGGIGTAPPMPPPDAESLLEAFQERYFQLRFQIRQFELDIRDLEENGANVAQVESLKNKMTTLIHREQVWIKKLAATIELFREVRKKAAGAGGD